MSKGTHLTIGKQNVTPVLIKIRILVVQYLKKKSESCKFSSSSVVSCGDKPLSNV